MEPEVDPFAEFNPETSPDMQTTVKPFTDTQRLIVQNFFDTNDAARAKYLKQLGYELDPRDSNMIRAIGTQGSYVPIDPGFSDAYKKGGLLGLGKEILQDAGDIGFDVTDIGAKVVAAIGGGTAGLGAGSIPLAMAGAAASGALTNSAKQKIRDMFLDEDMPFDAKEMALDSVLSAVGAGVFGGAAKGLRKIKDFDLTTRIDGIKNALKAAGNVADPDLIERAAREPELFTEEAVNGGSKRLAAAQKQIFGLDADEFITEARDLKRAKPDSYFGKLLNPLFQQQEKLYEEMALSPKANVSYMDAKTQLQNLYMSLERIVLRGNATNDEKQAFEVAGEQLRSLRKMAEDKIYSYMPNKISSNVNKSIPETSLKDVQFNFKEARDFLDRFQSKAFDKEKRTQNSLINQAAGGMRAYLDDVAVKSGVEKNGVNIGELVPQVNAKMSAIFDDYKTAKEKLLNTGNIINAYVGGSTPQSRIKGAEIESFMKRLDEDYKTDLAKDFELNTAQAIFESIYKGAPAKGSSRVNAFMVGETAKGIASGAGTGAFAGTLIPGVGTGTGAVIGGLVGGARAAKTAATLAQPEQGLRALGGMLEKQAARNAMDPAQLAIRDALTAGAGAGVTSQLGQVQGNAPEEIDPFAEFVP